jgi:uncharacterized protein with HEPN domain
MWRNEAYLLDMLQAAREIQKHSSGVSFETFASDRVLQNALMHLIQIIGEAARMVSPEYCQSHGEIPWSIIIGMRNRLVNE